MNWYKIALQVSDYLDRNIVNSKIKDLESNINTLNYLSNLIFHTARRSKEMLTAILESKSISSYPDVKKALAFAHKVALDNPYKFKIACQDAIRLIERNVHMLKKDREKYIKNIEYQVDKEN